MTFLQTARVLHDATAPGADRAISRDWESDARAVFWVILASQMSLSDPTTGTAPPHTTGRVRRLASRLVKAACRGYLLGAVLAWAALRFAGAGWWPGTLLALGPRWVLAVPLGVLVPSAVFWRRRSLGTLAVAAVVVVGPVMDLCVPWRRVLPATVGRLPLRVMTCNVHALAFRQARMAGLIRTAQPDVVAFEEWNGWPDRSATAVQGWHGATDFELHVESRWPVRKVADVIAGTGWAEGAATRYEVLTPGGPVPLIVAHLASPHGVIRTALKRQGGAGAAVRENAVTREDQARQVGDAARAAGPAVVCVGDMNLPCDAGPFRDGFAGLADAFSTGGFGFGWTYRVRWTTTRIDHVLTGPGWRCRRCWVGPDVGSPHRPVIAELERMGG